MHYEALVFDLDGTAIPKKPEGMPSQAVVDAVTKAKKACHVSIATGRPLQLCEDVLDALDIDDLCILNGGTHLYSRKTKEFVWKQEIDIVTLQELFSQLKHFDHYFVADEKHMQPISLANYHIEEPLGLPCIFSTSIEDAEKIVGLVKQFPEVTAHIVSSWKDGTFDIHISHELATKKHALQSLLARLGIDHSQVMVAGDGGNAADELKAQADWIAPTVDEDGLAVAIHKFILEE